jgi:hypothetical protein
VWSVKETSTEWHGVKELQCFCCLHISHSASTGWNLFLFLQGKKFSCSFDMDRMLAGNVSCIG